MEDWISTDASTVTDGSALSLSKPDVFFRNDMWNYPKPLESKSTLCVDGDATDVRLHTFSFSNNYNLRLSSFTDGTK